MHSPENNLSSGLILEAASQVIKEGSVAVVVTLIGGSAGVGAKLLVRESRDAAITGSLGNATLDQAVINQGRKFLETKEGTRAFQVREFAPALVEWADTEILFERLQPAVRLVICGAGHVGAALARLASLVGYHSVLIDDRAEFVNREQFPDERIELIAAHNWFEAVRGAVADGHGVSVAIVTRGHSEDEQCMSAVIGSEVDYIGLIGSKRRTNIVLERLREKGAKESQLEKVRAPVGLDIGAITPEEVALAIIAEIVAVRRGGEGGALSAWRREPKGKG